MSLSALGLLSAIGGGLSGYSSGSGLDLAMKLREQAALDELAVKKYQQFADIRGQEEQARWKSQQEYLRAQDLEAKLGSIMELAPQLDALGIPNEGFEGEDLYSRLQGLTYGEASALQGAMSGQVKSVVGQAELERENAKVAAEAERDYAAAIKDLEIGGWYARRPGESSTKPTKPDIITREDGTYAVYQIDGQIVSAKIPNIPGQTPGSSSAGKANASTRLKTLDTAIEEVSKWARQHPEQYALKNADGTMKMDKDGVPVLDQNKIAEEAERRAQSRITWAEGTPATGEEGGENPGGQEVKENPEDIIARLKAQGFSPEEIQMMAGLEGIEYDPNEGPFQ